MESNKINYEAYQFKILLTDYNFILIEQEVPFMKDSASIQINPDDIDDFIKGLKSLQPNIKEEIEIGKIAATIGEDLRVALWDLEKDEDTAQVILLHSDQLDLLFNWILAFKRKGVTH
ncbi:MAG: hypothetical protein HOD92_09600 [Deltaproteobacteria bacterium]|jgi:hypothetical protein|nr:hypothetical protein [Deltaproteobacteria bacterium]